MDLHVKHGGPAFPAEVDNNTGKTAEGFFDEPIGAGERHQYRGVTLRDYFAAAAATGFTSNQQWMKNASANTGKDADECIAISAYEVADALIAERAK